MEIFFLHFMKEDNKQISTCGQYGETAQYKVRRTYDVIIRSYDITYSLEKQTVFKYCLFYKMQLQVYRTYTV